MPKGTKSSASTATRKKHAKKSTKNDEDDDGLQAAGHQLQPGRKPKIKGANGQKLTKAQRKALPKVKQYIPPPKPPAPPIPDPLDGQGLARTLPAELVVVLRRLGKKDDVTRRKGLDELREEWILPLLRQGGSDEEQFQREVAEAAVLSAIPVWLHNLASLFQSPFHRTSALQIHNDLLSVSSLRSTIIDALALGFLPGTQDRDIIGSWMVAALEEGRRAGGQALRCWESAIRFGDDPSGAAGSAHTLDLVPHFTAIAEYISLSVLDPPTLHRDIHPPPVASAFASPTPTSGRGGKPAKGRVTPVTVLPTPILGADDDAELVEERWARYRVGGLVGLAWLVQRLPGAGLPQPPIEIAEILSNPVLWSALGTVSPFPDVEPIGQHPPIRRAAYVLLAALVDSYPAEVESRELLGLLSESVLASCWLEREAVVWEAAGPALVKFLTKYRQCWLLASSESRPIDKEDADADMDLDDEDSEDDAEPSSRDETTTPILPGASHSLPSATFDAFTAFISTICPSVPHLTYPLLLVVISTLPPTILPLETGPSPALQNLFSHLWSPVDARLLSTHSLPGSPSAFQAFLQAAIDSTVYLVGKSYSTAEHTTVEWLIRDQLVSRVWGEGVVVMGARAGRGRIAPSETEAELFAQAVARIAALSPELVAAMFPDLNRITLEACFPSEDTNRTITFLPRCLGVLVTVKAACPAAEAPIGALIVKVAEGCTERLFQLISEASPSSSVQAETLVEILSTCTDLFPAARVEVLSQGLQAHLNDLITTLSPQLVAALFNSTISVSNDHDGAALRASLWNFVDSPDGSLDARLALTAGILRIGTDGLHAENSLDLIALEATRASLLGDRLDPSALYISKSAVNNNKWLSDTALNSIIHLVCTSIHDTIDGLLNDRAEIDVPSAALDILSSFASGSGLEPLVTSYAHALVAVHHLVVIAPRLGLETVTVPASASTIWAAASSLSPELRETLGASVSASLANLLDHVSCQVDPSTLVDVALATDLGVAPSPADVARTLLPSPEEMIIRMSKHTLQRPHPILPIIDPLVSCVATSGQATTSRPSDYDSVGRSQAARYAEAGLALLRADRHLVESIPSFLQVAVSVLILAQDAMSIPGASRDLYAPGIPVSYLDHMVRDAERALSFSLALVDESSLAWHTASVQQLKARAASASADFLQRLLVDISIQIESQGGDVAPRAFREVLGRHLRQSGAGEAEGEVWLTYAMFASDKAPAIATATLLAIKPIMLENKAFATAQNRLASAITGISIRQANERGIPALCLLIASAPPPDAPAVFLPQQRAMFVLRHVSGWLASEDDAADDLSDEVDVRVAELYATLAPIVQDLEGAHWDAIFDLVEGALESGSLDDPSSYPLLHAGLILLQQIRDLCQTNKKLRAVWVAKSTHLALVVKLFLQCRDADSVPLQLIHTLILNLLQDANESVMAKASLRELCDLLRLSSSSAIQCTAYRLLSQVVHQNTLALVLEVEASVVDAESSEDQNHREIVLPGQLVDIVDAGRGVDWHIDPKAEIVLGQLLAWMAVMDHFEDASRTLRWAYLDQLNSTRLLEQSLLPLLFAMLGVSEVGAWNFPANQYAVDEFYPDLLVPDELPDLVPLASHVYYRTLSTIPSAMRTYYESLKDRQLSLSLLAFTARYFSPVIIQHEFAALREPRSLAELNEEGLNVRIAQGGGAAVAGTGGAAEAIASYMVDEQPMEIGIRLPAEFPLKAVDVRDLRRVGVPENKWRGWLMSVQQTITSRNGLILEALTVFKKNVSLHFEGVVECAICYSIISVTDRSLPSKPCRTCKNRFHAGCLFKWFNSSHSSSCPMCRSLF